ncbi:MAG: phosphatase PAP2 family protein [Nitrospirae bacterium]|nr:phosphatase PAP2 family protein [Nitrospirota bacterium]
MDASLFLLINQGLHNNVLDSFMTFITNKSYILFIAILIPLFFKDWRKGLLVFSLAAMGFFTADGIGDILKRLFARPRPCHELHNVSLVVECVKSFSFPSGHAATSFAMASIIGHHFRRAAIPAFLLAALVAFTRIYVGVHYPSDVIGGAVLGGVTGGFILFIHQWPAGRR